MRPLDPVAVLRDLDIIEATHALRAAGFRTCVLEKGTICAYKGERSYGFGPRHGRFCRESVARAIEDNA